MREPEPTFYAYHLHDVKVITMLITTTIHGERENMSILLDKTRDIALI